MAILQLVDKHQWLACKKMPYVEINPMESK